MFSTTFFANGARRFLAAAGLAALLPGAAAAQEAREVKIAIVSFLSGPAAVHFGIPAKNGAEFTIDAINAGTVPAPFAGAGLAGAQIVPVYVDEAGGATKQVAELRNLVQRRGVDVAMGYISSGDCLAIPKTAEELRILTVLTECGTPRVFEEASYRYVFRTGPHAVMDNVAAARYLAEMFPDLDSIAGLNQNYAWGQDSWSDFVASMKAVNDRTTVVDAQFPKLFAGQFGAEISTLLARRPDIIHSSFWGADLEALINQGAGRGLFRRSKVVLSTGEHILPLIGNRLPDGTVIGARGRHGDFAPDSELNRWLRAGYIERYGTPPSQPVYKFVMALLGLKKAWDMAAERAGGFPDQDGVIDAFTGLEWDTPSGPIRMALADGHQAIQANAIGLTRWDEELGRITVEKVRTYPAECVNPPPDMDGIPWIEAGFPGAKCD